MTSEAAYGEMWRRLVEEYDDPGLSVQSALKKLRMLKPVADKDYSDIVRLSDEVEGIRNQLQELGQLEAIHTCDVDQVCRLLPNEMARTWTHVYLEL